MTIQRNTTELQKDSQQNTYSDEAKTREEVADRIITGDMTDGNEVVATIYNNE